MTYLDGCHEAELGSNHLRRLELLGTIARGAAHDLNNHLTAILLGLENALLAPAIATASVEEAISGLRRASDLTDRLLHLSGPDREPEPYDLASSVRLDEPLLRAVVPPRIAFSIRIEDEPLGVLADQARIQQTLLNLVLNSAKAIGTGAGKVELRLRKVAPSWVELRVEDDGCGMDDAVRARLFEPFRSSSRGGRGMGLFSVFEAVSAARGTISVDSTPGKGTRMEIRLPRADLPAVQVEAAKVGTASRVGAGRKLLLVEDDPFVRQMVASTLGRAGFTPFTANSVEMARDLLDAVGIVSGALVDASLPGPEDGSRFIRELRERLPGAKLLLMSGYDEEAVAGKGDARPDLFLKKPFSGADLRDRIVELLDSRDEGTPPSSSPRE